MTTREAAERYGVSTSTIARWREKGKISGRKVRGRWVYEPIAEKTLLLSLPEPGWVRPTGPPVMSHDQLLARGWIPFSDISYGFAPGDVTAAMLHEAIGPDGKLVEHEGEWYVEGEQRVALDNYLRNLATDEHTRQAVEDGSMLVPMPTDWLELRELGTELGERRFPELVRKANLKMDHRWVHHVSPTEADRLRREYGKLPPEPSWRDRVLAAMRVIRAGEAPEWLWMTQDGKPYTRSIERMTGWNITAAERDELWLETAAEDTEESE